MKTLISKATSAATATLALLVVCVLAGLGLTALLYLALLGFVAMGIGLVAAPFVPIAQKQSASDLSTEK